MGERVTHSTPFRRAVEEGLLSPEHVVQIGLRGTTYGSTDYDWPRQQVSVLMAVASRQVMHGTYVGI